MPRKAGTTNVGISLDAQLNRRPYWNKLPVAVRAPIVSHLLTTADTMFGYQGGTIPSRAVPTGGVPTRAAGVGGRGGRRKAQQNTILGGGT